MAAQTLTDTQANHDSSAVSGLLDGENYTLNNSTLTINGDVRWGFNAAVIGRVTISATLGGQIITDGRDVWEVPFSSSTGNVPAVAAVGQNAVTGTGITGELFRVWATGSLTPSAAGGAMPATGWIKLRSKTGTFSNGLVVTLPGGATITCSGAGKRSWIHVVGGETLDFTIPRLGKWTCRGDWYELGTTNGADDQTFQFPVADACPAIQIETAAGSGIYEWYLNAGSRWGSATVYVPTDVRGKYFGMVNSTGVITIARRASNACGFKPPTGCRVRIPNVIFSSSTSTNWALNTINATQTTRYDLVTSSAGEVDVDYACCNWYISATNAFRVQITNSSILHGLLISNVADTVTMNNVAVGLDSTTDVTAVTLSNCFTQINLTNVRATKYAAGASGAVTISVTDCANYIETDCAGEMFGSTTAITRGNATVYSRLLTRLAGTNLITRPISIGGYINIVTCVANLTIKDTKYADQLNGTTVNTNPVSAITPTGASANVIIDGFSAFGGLANVHPYTSIFAVSVGSANITVQNIGTAAAPYNCGSANATGLGVSATTMVNLQLRRIYLDNVRTAALSLANTVQDVVCDNVWSDGADTQAIPSVNTLVRGCRWTNSTTGQTAVYGRHWEDAWTSTTAGRLLIACNEPLPSTSNQCEITAGTPAFTSAGQVAMRAVGDEVIWTMPYFLLGVTRFTNSNPTVTGTGATFVSGNNWTNFFLDFQYDTGTGFNGTWLALNGATLNGIGVINANTGVKLKVRAQTKTASTTNALTYIRIDTTTDATSQRIAYPLPGNVLTLTGVPSGSDMVVLESGTSNILYQRDGAGEETSQVPYPNIINDPDFTGGSPVAEWVAWSGAYTIVSGALRYTAPTGDWVGGRYALTGLTIGLTYNVQVTARSPTGKIVLIAIDTPQPTVNFSEQITSTQYVTRTGQFVATSTSHEIFAMFYQTGIVAGEYFEIDQLTVARNGTYTVGAGGGPYQFEYVGAQTVDIGLLKPGYIPFYLRSLALTTTDSSIPVSLTVDRNYS